MPDIYENFNTEEFSLIDNGAIAHNFNVLYDDILMLVFDQNNNLVIDPAGNEAAYFIYDSSKFDVETYNPLLSESVVENTLIGFQILGTDVTLNQTNGMVTNGNINIVPNKILSSKFFPSGNYVLEFRFLRNFFSEGERRGGIFEDSARFIIETISPSRKEIRLYAVQENISDVTTSFEIIHNMTEAQNVNSDGTNAIDEVFGSGNADEVNNLYSIFNHVLGVPHTIGGQNFSSFISITNYTIDNVTNTDNRSLILRLDKPVPTFLTAPNEVSIDREVISYQIQNINYISNLVGTTEVTYLEVDESFLINTTNDQGLDDLENYNQLITGSDDNVLHDVLNDINNKDINLNIDYSNFNNFTFFGSAEQKIINFKEKVLEIDHYLNEVSSSLKTSGSSAGSRRIELFDNIGNVKSTFTPYEKFLYNDNQTTSTGSVPGIGKNLAPSTPVSGGAQMTEMKNYEGFGNVFRHTNDNFTGSVHLFTNQFRVEEAPFYNYSGSVYLSFLLKGGINSNVLHLSGSSNYYNNPILPNMVYGSGSILEPSITASGYQRYIYEASQSYWRPHLIGFPESSTNVTAVLQSNFDGPVGYSQTSDTENPFIIQILSGSSITGSHPVVAPNNYAKLGYNVDNNPTIFTGSIAPMGDLFPLSWASHQHALSSVSSSFITDVKVTLNNPLNTRPFSPIYRPPSGSYAGSTEWNNWYDGIITSASTFDTNNIHSLQNNLPKIINEDDESSDLKKFLNMISEHFDLIRNYVDNYSNFYKRGYKKDESVPDNLLPILAGNLGWDLINPFDSNLTDYYQSIVSGSGTTVQEVTNNTWRNILNNLVYIYKSKGTLSSVKSLLNVYGYPPDMLKLNEHGGSLEPSNPEIITNDISLLLKGLRGTDGNVSFVNEQGLFHTINLNPRNNKLNLDWWTNDANGDAVEFVFASNEGFNDQVILESSGSLTQSLWDLRIISDGTNKKSGSLQFRLNNSSLGNSSLASNAVSMSTDYLTLRDGKFWNVMLSRDTSSLSSEITQSYKLIVGFQDEDKITKFNAVSMSVYNKIANTNFMSGSSLDITSSYPVSGNLVVGETFSGSIGEFRNWSGSLNVSKFKQHILNKSSVVGNSISSSRESLIYRYRFNEGLSRGSNMVINDANFNYFKDYSKTTSLTNLGSLFDKHIIDFYKLSLRSDGVETIEDNHILIESPKRFIENLNPDRYSNIGIEDKRTPLNKRDNSFTVDISRSPTDKVDEYIINQISDYDISDKFADPQNLFKSEYTELDDFRGEVLTGVKVDINKYISAQERIFNHAILDSIEKILPGRSVLDYKGIVIKQDFLKRSKIKHHEASIQHGEDANDFKVSYDIRFDLTNSTYNEFNKGKFSFLDFYVSSGSYIDTYKNDPALTMVNKHFNLSNTTYESIHKSPLDFLTFMNLSGSYQELFIFENSSPIDYTKNYYLLNKSTYEQNHNANSIQTNSYLFFSGSYQESFILENSPSLKYTAEYYKLSNSVYSDIYKTSIDQIDDTLFISGSYRDTFIFEPSTKLDFISTYISLADSARNDIHTTRDINYVNETLLVTGSYSDIIIKENSLYLNFVKSYLDLTNSQYNETYKNDSIYIILDNLVMSGSFKPVDFYENTGQYLMSLTDFLNVSSVHNASHNTTLSELDYHTISSSFNSTRENTALDYVKEYYKLTNSTFDVKKSGDVNLYDNSYIVTGSYQDNYIFDSQKLDFTKLYFKLTNSAYNEKYVSAIDFYNDYLVVSGSYKSQILFENLPFLDYVSNYYLAKASYNKAHKSTIDINDNFYDISSSYQDVFLYKNPILINFGDYTTIIKTSGESDLIKNGTTREFADINLDQKVPWQDEFGNEVHFPHFANLGGNDDYNTNYYERDVVFYTLGDSELQSGSFEPGTSNWEFDHSNIKTFSNTIFIDKNKGSWNNIYYNSYWNVVGSDDPKNPVPGRMLGRTAYYSASEGNIFYPSNHYTIAGTSKQSIPRVFYDGTQNIGTPFNHPRGLDITTASAYTIDVAGADTDKILKVERK
jgi:hypothetical protein